MDDIDETFAKQWDREDMQHMTSEQINAAYHAGQLKSVMENPSWVRPGKLEQRMEIAAAEAQTAALEQARLAMRLHIDPEAVIHEVMSGGVAKQLTRDDLANMTHEQINEAREAGQLNKLLGIS